MMMMMMMMNEERYSYALWEDIVDNVVPLFAAVVVAAEDAGVERRDCVLL
jgi:hypothetical protein